ncbi:MAG: hypothetical protein ABI543_02965 [Ignavibacteria bacterium]
MPEADRYFDKFSIAGLVLLLPVTVILLSILLRGINSEILFYALFQIKNVVNPYVVMNIASLFSFVICITDIIRINHKEFNNKFEERFVYQKSFLNTALVFVNSSYIIIIYLYYDLVKLGNIPVGRN